MTTASDKGFQIGRKIAPPRFIVFMVVAIVGAAVAIGPLGWREGTMAAFDCAAIIFLVSVYPLLCSEADQMREAARRNDANRAFLLLITLVVSMTVLVAVAAELSQKGGLKPPIVAMIVGTLALCWVFSNTIYALHYAHIFYTLDGDGEGDSGGIEFPKTPEPDYWDFIYFAFCLGMTFQVSDMDITSGRVRKVVTAHCLAAFIFNLGVLAFTINTLGGGGS
ncbi:putative membrane protein [Sphingomonas vulcanisoli]|uniref:Membrane protein n=1 Tax=Sphingomonas vulcanisoli TaxID=1658060 RepID=A0ABX0TU05_9SPHN|nr:DUF1345 domain-containing protein [Sphingomonas vulcanisoli]NIJ09007.1 putative membrane protein [Sphingomonas vulcanisoli]